MKKFIFISPLVLITIIYFSIIKTLPDAISIAPEHEEIYYEASEITLTTSSCRDLIGHFSMYMILSASVFFDLYIRDKKGIILFWGALAFPILFGGAMELTQKYFFPPRNAEWSDFLTNTTGSILGFLVIRYTTRKEKIFL